MSQRSHRSGPFEARRTRFSVAPEPGYTATDPNLHQGTQAAEIIVPMAQVGPDVPLAVNSTLRDR